MALASHSAYEDCFRVIRTKIASATSFLKDNTRCTTEAKNSLSKIERQMRLLVLELVRLGKSRDQLEGALDFTFGHLKNKEHFLEDLLNY